MTRAVIELPNDISFTMPLMQKKIPGCAYNPVVPIAAFRYKNSSVIVEKNKITIDNAEDETTAQNVMDLLKHVIDTANQDEG